MLYVDMLMVKIFINSYHFLGGLERVEVLLVGGFGLPRIEELFLGLFLFGFYWFRGLTEYLGLLWGFLRV